MRFRFPAPALVGLATVLLLLLAACSGSGSTGSQPAGTPTPSPSPTTLAEFTAKQIYDKSVAAMVGLSYTVHRQWLRPQPQTLAPTRFSPGQAPDLTMAAIASPVYSLASTTDTSIHCPNTVCFIVQVAGTAPGSAASCSPPVVIATDVYIDGTTYRSLSRHVVSTGGGSSGCPAVDLEGWDSVSFP